MLRSVREIIINTGDEEVTNLSISIGLSPIGKNETRQKFYDRVDELLYTSKRTEKGTITEGDPIWYQLTDGY